MNIEENERIIIPDEHGEEHLFELLYKFTIEETGDSYVCLIPVEQVNREEAEVYAFRYEDNENEDENDLKLFPIESDEEWDMVEEMINTLTENEA